MRIRTQKKFVVLSTGLICKTQKRCNQCKNKHTGCTLFITKEVKLLETVNLILELIKNINRLSEREYMQLKQLIAENNDIDRCNKNYSIDFVTKVKYY